MRAELNLAAVFRDYAMPANRLECVLDLRPAGRRVFEGSGKQRLPLAVPLVARG